MGTGKATDAKAPLSPELILGQTCAGPGCHKTKFLIWGTYVDDNGPDRRYVCCSDCGQAFADARRHKRLTHQVDVELRPVLKAA